MLIYKRKSNQSLHLIQLNFFLIFIYYNYIMYKTFVLILFILGIIFITSSVSQTMGEKTVERVIYKYIPRTLEEEENDQAYPSEIFSAMFTQPSTWIGNINDLDTRKREGINQYFVSQI